MPYLQDFCIFRYGKLKLPHLQDCCIFAIIWMYTPETEIAPFAQFLHIWMYTRN